MAIQAGHHSRVWYTTSEVSIGNEPTLSGLKAAFEGVASQELVGVRAMPELAQQTELVSYPVYQSSYNWLRPGTTSLQPAVFTLNYHADQHTVAGALQTAITNRRAVVLCVGLSATKLTTYSGTTQRYYSYGVFADRTVTSSLSDVVQASVTFIPYCPWFGPN